MQHIRENKKRESSLGKKNRLTGEAGSDWNMPGIPPPLSSTHLSLCEERHCPMSHAGSLVRVCVWWGVTFHVVLSDQRTCSSICPALSAGRQCRSGPSAGTCAAARSPVWRCTKSYWTDITWMGNRNGEWPACERSLICLLSWTTSLCVCLKSESSWLLRKTNINTISP